MAVRLRASEFTVTGTAQKLTTILGLPEQQFYSTLAVRANFNNAGDIWIGDSAALTVAANRGGYLHPDDALTIDLKDGRSSTDNIWFIASSPGDTLHILRFE
jgi:hypothetical protein